MKKIYRQIEQAAKKAAKKQEALLKKDAQKFEISNYHFVEKKRNFVLISITHDFVKANDAEFADQLDKFSNSLNGATEPTELAVKYGYTTADLLEIKNDAAYFRYWVTKHGAGETYKKAWTQKGNEMRSGTGSSVTSFPVGADVSTPPTAVLPGIETRFREKARKAKGQTRIYSVGDGTNMGIEVISSAFVPSDGKPELKISLTDGGHPKIEYVKSKYAGINLYKNANDGKGWALYVTCNDPSCVDMSPLPAVDQSAAWKYKAIYMYGGAEVGAMSLETAITVIGTL